MHVRKCIPEKMSEFTTNNINQNRLIRSTGNKSWRGPPDDGCTFAGFSQFLVFKVKSQFIGRNVQRTPGTSAGVGRLGEITGEPREGQIYDQLLSLHDECT